MSRRRRVFPNCAAANHLSREKIAIQFLRVLIKWVGRARRRRYRSSPLRLISIACERGGAAFPVARAQRFVVRGKKRLQSPVWILAILSRHARGSLYRRFSTISHLARAHARMRVRSPIFDIGFAIEGKKNRQDGRIRNTIISCDFFYN